MTNEEDQIESVEAAPRAHWSFWVIGVIALVWNVMGSINFVVQMNPEMVASYRESEQAIIEGRPLWATVAFAIGVFGGSLGAVLLLWRKKSAFYVFIVSLFGVIATMIHTLTQGISFGAGEIAGIIVMPVALAVFLVWYSKRAEIG